MKRLLFSIAAIFMGFLIMTAPVSAKCVRTAVLGGSVCDASDNKVADGIKADGVSYFNCSCDEEDNGQGIKNILKLVVEIMTISVGALATLGIGISGVQYLTAGGNEEKTRKAKRRIVEIVIGLAAYAIIYALLYFLVPDFKPFG